MDIGVVFPTTEMGQDRAVLRDWLQTADGLGFSHVLLNDHVVGAEHENRDPPLANAYKIDDLFHEPLTFAAWGAGVTHNLGFVTGVLVLPQRQTVLVAKQAAQVAILNDNRFRLGVGVGWNYVEYESLGENFRNRGKRQEEQVELLRLLWTTPNLDYTGQWHRIDRAGLLPLPEKPIPIWFGGFGEVAFERAARIGDGFLQLRLLRPTEEGFRSEPIDGPIASAAKMRAMVAANGRDPNSFQVEGRMNYVDGPAVWGGEVEAFRAARFERIAVQPVTAGIESPTAHVRALETFAREVGLKPR